MAYTLDTATEITQDVTTGQSQSHTCAAGADLLVVCLGVRGTPTTAVTYGGQALTLAVSHAFTGHDEKTEIWYKVSPLTGANTVAIALGASVGHGAIISSWLADGTPALDVTATDGGTGTPSENPNVTLSGSVGVLAIDCMNCEMGIGAEGDWTSLGGSGDTVLQRMTTGSWSICASYKLNPASNESFSWGELTGTPAVDDAWTSVAASFKDVVPAVSQRFMWMP